MKTAPLEKVDAGRAVLAALKAEGVRRVYTLPGSHILPVYDAILHESDIQLILCKIEASISFMADVHGRLTGEPGVCLVTAGPGALNSAGGVAQAMASASPLVHISGAVPPGAGREAFHGVDDPDFTRKAFEPITKWSVRVEAIEEIPAVLSRAFHVARSGRPGPVHVEMPRVTNTSPNMIAAEPAPAPPYAPLPPAFALPEGEELEALRDALRRAERPLIVAGKGVPRRGACLLLAQVAEQLSAPVVQVQDALGALPGDHPFAAGFLSMWSVSPAARAALREADLILAVGMRQGSSTAKRLYEIAGAPIHFASFDGPGEALPGPRTLAADPPALLARLREGAAEAPPERGEAVRRALALAREEERRQMRVLLDRHREDVPLHPGVVADALCQEMAEDAILASDVGNCAVWLRSLVPIRGPFSHLQSGTWNSMGFSLPACIAAKLAFPEREVVGVAGDGALLMTLGEFSTAADAGTPIVMVVLNDAGWGMIAQMQRASFGRSGGYAYREADLAGTARSLGGEGFRVETPKELRPALRQALSCGRPAVVDVITGDYPYPSFEFR